MTDKTSVVVMTLVGDAPLGGDPLWNQLDSLPVPVGFCWRFVPDGPFAIQIRSILRTGGRVVVVCVGKDDAIDRAATLIGRLLGAGIKIVIAIAQVHDPTSESVLRQAGALYICANEARQRLGPVLESIINRQPRSTNGKTLGASTEIRMDAS